jgi:hypothetical protein
MEKSLYFILNNVERSQTMAKKTKSTISTRKKHKHLKILEIYDVKSADISSKPGTKARRQAEEKLSEILRIIHESQCPVCKYRLQAALDAEVRPIDD